MFQLSETDKKYLFHLFFYQITSNYLPHTKRWVLISPNFMLLYETVFRSFFALRIIQTIRDILAYFWPPSPPCVILWHCREYPSPLECHVLFEWPLIVWVWNFRWKEICAKVACKMLVKLTPGFLQVSLWTKCQVATSDLWMRFLDCTAFLKSLHWLLFQALQKCNV